MTVLSEQYQILNEISIRNFPMFVKLSVRSWKSTRNFVINLDVNWVLALLDLSITENYTLSIYLEGILWSRNHLATSCDKLTLRYSNWNSLYYFYDVQDMFTSHADILYLYSTSSSNLILTEYNRNSEKRNSFRKLKWLSTDCWSKNPIFFYVRFLDKW